LSVWREKPVLETVQKLRNAGKIVYLLGQFKIIQDKSPIDIAIGKLRFGGTDNYLERFIVEKPFQLDGEYAKKINALGALYVANKPFFMMAFTTSTTAKLACF